MNPFKFTRDDFYRYSYHVLDRATGIDLGRVHRIGDPNWPGAWTWFSHNGERGRRSTRQEAAESLLNSYRVPVEETA